MTKKFTYFEELYPEVMECDAWEDAELMQKKGYELALGLWRTDGKTIYCSRCENDLVDNPDDIEQYAICPYCGACLFDID